MTGKERFLQTLRFEPPDRPSHFESMFELEREAFGLQFPDRNEWHTDKERKIATCLEIYERIVERYQWDALAVFWPWGDPAGVAAAKRTFGERIAIGGMVGGCVWCIDQIADWDEFALWLTEQRDKIHEWAEARCRAGLELIDRFVDAGADFIFLPHDVAHNGGPFCAPADFAEITAPYLARLVARVKERGAKAIVHSDGMLLPILDQLLLGQPHVLHSLDPMAGMDIAAIKKLTYGKVALMGNVQCNYLQDGPREKIRESARYCLEHATPGGGYIFSTSNTIFPGMPLENYEYMLEVFREFCKRQTPGRDGSPSRPLPGSLTTTDASERRPYQRTGEQSL